MPDKEKNKSWWKYFSYSILRIFANNRWQGINFRLIELKIK